MSIKVLITGSSGFIGSRLAIRCNDAGMNVIATSRKKEKKIESKIGFSIKKLNILQNTIIDQKIEADVILHTATANEIVSKDFTAGTNLTVVGTKNIFELAWKKGIRKIIYFSSVKIYGDEIFGELNEETPICCENSYALNHFMGEKVCQMFGKQYGIDVVILRLSNVYGIPDTDLINRPTLVPMCFTTEAKKNGKLKIKSSGLQKRNFISSNEVSNYCIELINNFPKGFNIINGISNFNLSIKEVVEMTSKIFYKKKSKKLKIEYLSNQPSKSNEFILKSKLHYITISEKESKKQFEKVIWSLI